MQRIIVKFARRAVVLALVVVAPLDAAAQATRDGFDKGLLWRVERPGVAPSYLFGTVHLADKRVTALPEPVRRQLDVAQSFTMEIALDPSNTAALAARMVYNDGRDLPMVAGTDLFGEVVTLLAGKGVPQEFVRLFKPWAVMLMLVMPQQRSEDVLDVMLHRIASGQGKSLHYLETVDDQVAVLEGMPEADQVALLKHAVATQHALPAMTGKLLEAYLQRDLGLIWRINEASVKDRPELKVLNEVFVRRLLLDRSARMVERMQPQLRAGNAFVAVGALHLYGEQGILGLLQRDGYRVSRVY